MSKVCGCYNPCKHEEQVIIELSIPMSVYDTLKYRHAENKDISIEEDIINTLACEDFFSCDMDEYERYLQCKSRGECDGNWQHHHLLDTE